MGDQHPLSYRHIFLLFLPYLSLCQPLGSFSMAPVLAADNIVNDEVTNDDSTNDEENSENVHTALIIPIRIIY